MILGPAAPRGLRTPWAHHIGLPILPQLFQMVFIGGSWHSCSTLLLRHELCPHRLALLLGKCPGTGKTVW